MPITLRGYQQKALADVQAEYLARTLRVLLVAPTGAGKSKMMAYMLSRTGKLALILVHRDNLLKMISADLTASGIPHGIIGGKCAPTERVHIGLMQTVSRRLDVLPQYQWVISDEAHLAMCETWMRILKHYARAWHLGLSATPCRLDGKGLGAAYEKIVFGPSIRELTAGLFLVPARVFAPPGSQIQRSATGKVDMLAAGELMERRSVVGDILATWQRLAGGVLTLGFACTVKHAETYAQQFRAAGIPSAHIEGGMTAAEQDRILSAFQGGRIRVLWNVELLTTGYDFPALGCLIFARPTESLALYLQMIGRVLRTSPSKTEGLVIDHVGNCLQHGMPAADRQWTLEGSLRRGQPVSIRMCPACYAVHEPAPRCPSCQAVYPAPKAKPRRPLTVEAGALVEAKGDAPRVLTQEQVIARMRSAFSFAQIDAIRIAAGYKPGWTGMQLALRKRFKRRRAA